MASAGRQPRATVGAARRVHILDGDESGGGHGPGRGRAGKTEFPEGWDDDRIIRAIEDVANDPASIRRAGRLGRVIISGSRDAVDIEVILDADGTTIVTGYPTNLARNPRSPA